MSKVSMGWGDAFKSIPGEQIAAEAAIGGVGGMGVNYVANSNSGESGGYLGAAAIGAGVGGVARGGLRKLGANRADRLATEAAEAAAEKAERDAIRSANRTNLRTSIVDKSVNIYGSMKNKIGGVIDTLKTVGPDILAPEAMQAARFNTLPRAKFTPTLATSQSDAIASAVKKGNYHHITGVNNGFGASGPNRGGVLSSTTPPIDNSFRATMLRSAGTLDEYQRNIDTSSALDDLSRLYN